MATLSVVALNYNHARYLPESLSALTSQSRSADEIIVIDDASTDNSVDVIEAFARPNRNLRLRRNPVNRGIVANLNEALSEARGDYIYDAAADDRVLPGFFEKSMAMLERFPQAGLCFSDPATFRDEPGSFRENRLGLRAEPTFLEPTELVRRLRQRRFWIAHHTAPVKTEALREAGFVPELRWHTDWFAVLVIAFRYGACYVPEPLAALRVSPHSYSGKGIKRRDEQYRIYQRMLELLERSRYADAADAFRDSLVFSTFGFQMWTVMGSDARWAKYRSPELRRAIVRGEIIGRLGACSPRTLRLLSRVVSAWRGRRFAAV